MLLGRLAPVIPKRMFLKSLLLQVLAWHTLVSVVVTLDFSMWRWQRVDFSIFTQGMRCSHGGCIRHTD